MPLTAVDRAAAEYANGLSIVLDELETRLLGLVGEAKLARDTFDAATLLNSRGEFLQALRDSGYYDLAQAHVDKYPGIVQAVMTDFAAKKLPAVSFTQVNVETFQQIALADLQMFDNIGKKAVDDIRLELYRHSVSSRPFSDMVRTIRASTVGVSKRGTPLKNYSYTHANTAILNFGDDVIRVAGEEIGADRWQVLGPNDSVTRDVCRRALARPIRTKEEWITAKYWARTPKRWSCRHYTYPYFGDEEQ